MDVSQRLLKCLGPETMRRLCDEFGGRRLYIPRRLPEPDRDEIIRVRFDEYLSAGGTCMNSYRSIAEQVGLSVRRVQEIVTDMPMSRY